MNTTENSVKDEKRKLTDEEIGKLYKRMNEIIRRVTTGAISYNDALAGMQEIIEGKSKRLRLDLIPQKKWWEENGVIYFKVRSDGTTGEQWITRLEKQGFKLSKHTKELLLSKDFETTMGVEYTIAVLKGGIFNVTDRYSLEICREAKKRKLIKPSSEISCLILENFSEDEIKEMGISLIVIFHYPIKDASGALYLLSVCDKKLYGNSGNDSSGWGFENGFAFEHSRKQIA